VNALKRHFAATSPGCNVKLIDGAYCIYLPPIEEEPDFIIAVHTRVEMKRNLLKMRAARNKK